MAGASRADDNGIDSGAAYLFARNAGGRNNWGETSKLLPSDGQENDYFGTAVAADWPTVVVGATNDNPDTADPGSAYVFDITDVCYTVSLPHNQWRQLSLPGDPGNENTVAAIFGDDIPGNYDETWRVYVYDPVTNQYIDPGYNGTIAQGQGLWILQLTGTAVDIDMPESTTPTPVGFPGACNEPEGCYSLSLAGPTSSIQWNMIGFPFCGSENVELFRVVTAASTPVHDCSDADGCTLSEANEAQVLHDVFWHYVDETTGYQAVRPGKALSPWDGFWAAAMTNSDPTGTSLLVPASP